MVVLDGALLESTQPLQNFEHVAHVLERASAILVGQELSDGPTDSLALCLGPEQDAARKDKILQIGQRLDGVELLHREAPGDEVQCLGQLVGVPADRIAHVRQPVDGLHVDGLLALRQVGTRLLASLQVAVVSLDGRVGRGLQVA